MIKQKIVDYINGMNDDEVIELHNRYCEAAGCEDDRIYSMWDLDELLELAAKIRAAKTWVEVEGELMALCDAAGMADEYKAADGDNFEAVIYKAAERLGVDV